MDQSLTAFPQPNLRSPTEPLVPERPEPTTLPGHPAEESGDLADQGGNDDGGDE